VGEEPLTATPRTKKRQKSSIQEIVETLLMAVVIFLVLHSVILPFRVDGFSMEPTLHDREMLFINRRAYSHVDVNRVLNLIPGVDRPENKDWYPFSPPQRGDIVVFDPPGQHTEPYIKRIIGLPGDHIAIHDGGVYINGQRLDEPYLRSDTSWRGITSQDYVVEPGHLFVMGDNRNNSSDSRVFGAVPISSVIGKAWVAYWPLADAKLISHPDYSIDR
jgi:signal peptidase I